MTQARHEGGMEGRSGVITRLAVRSGRPDRTRVYVDGRLVAELATQVVDEARLHEGYRLEEHRLAELLADDEPHRARSRALHMLAGRDRSVAEVRQRLASAGFSASAIASTVEWLSALGYLDDQRFAGRYVHEKVKAGWGERRLRVELTRKGVERKHVEEALAAVHEEEQVVGGQHETLVSLVQRRFARSWVEDREGSERRLAGFLLRRGFGWDDVSRMVRLMDEGHPGSGGAGQGDAP